MKTSKGYKLAWTVKCTYSVQGFEGHSGRVKLVADDPSQDRVVRWDSNNNPIDHDFGSLVRATGLNNATVGKPSGFENIFESLVGSKA